MTMQPRQSDLRTAGLTAEVLLRIQSAKLYGFIEGGPPINVERCEEVLEQARAAGFTYSEDEITEAGRQWMAWQNATPAERAAALGEEVE
jgi:hypothetical protein